MLVYGVLTSIVEMGTFLPIPGSSMSYFANRFVSPSLGFALGWLYFYAFGIVVAYELVAASILINYWPNSVNVGVWITIMMVAIVALNLCPVGVYAEAEFWFAGLKIILILGLLLVALILMAGGGPDHMALGFRYWSDPGAVKTYMVGGTGGQFTAFLYVWVFSTFSFNFGPEQLILTAGEMRNPRKNLPSAARRFFFRMVVFYVLGTLAIGAICSSTAQGLTTDAGNANASPWVIAIQNAGISTLPSIINAAILISALSAGNSYLYMCSRTLYSLALAGNAPKIFTRCNKYGLPIYAVSAASLFAPLAYMDCGKQAGDIFNWFVALTNTAGYTSWIVSCIIYLRFRKAIECQGIIVPWRSFVQPWACYICLALFTLLLMCNGFTVFFPGQFSVSSFMTAYVGILVFFALYVGHKVVVGQADPWWHDPATVDTVSGLRGVEADEDFWKESEASVEEEFLNRLPVHIWKKMTLIWG